MSTPAVLATGGRRPEPLAQSIANSPIRRLAADLEAMAAETNAAQTTTARRVRSEGRRGRVGRVRLVRARGQNTRWVSDSTTRLAPERFHLLVPS